MIMFKNLSPTMKLFAGLIIGVIVITIILMSISGNSVSTESKAHYINDNASADNKVEALKTMTADLLSVENKNKQLQQTVENLQTQNKQVVDNLKQSLSSQVQKALQQIQAENTKKQSAFEERLKQKPNSSMQDYPINGVSTSNGAFVWVTDMSSARQKENRFKKHHSLLSFGSDSDSNSLLHSSNDQIGSSNNKKINHIKPIYTIPVNATLTGATLMTPLVGRVPIDGKLPSPYHFKLVLSAINLTANGYSMPGVKGAVMSGVASGDMLGSCARGQIHSITFIFNDGRISTTEAKGDNDSLGYLSSQTGNPCIAGSFHSNAAIFLGAQMGLSAGQGYANAITDSQYMNSTTPEGVSIHTLMGNANKAAIGQGGSAAAEAAQTWWNRRVQNSFDYVYVSNVSLKTGKLMTVAVNITQQIPINYDKKARKVNYEDTLQKINRELD
jgi:integrating conjugative element protein (TIGR03752 family)